MDNATVVRKLMTQVWRGRNLGLIDRHVSPAYRESAPFGDVIGRDGYHDGVAMFNSAFHSIGIVVHDQLVDGDKVCSRFTFTGIHAGEFLGVPATGSPVEMTGMDLVRFEDGLIVEEWISLDLWGLMTQLGAFPRSSPPPELRRVSRLAPTTGRGPSVTR